MLLYVAVTLEEIVLGSYPVLLPDQGLPEPDLYQFFREIYLLPY